MLGKTHSIFGVCCALGALIAFQEHDPVMAGIAVVSASLGALTPDLDHPQATLSRKNIVMGAASQFMSGLSKHRRFWHTIPACLLFTAVFFVLIGVVGNAVGSAIKDYVKVPNLYPYYINAAIYFFIGALSHLVADAFNPEGSPILYPVQRDLGKKVHVPIVSVETGSPGEIIYRWIFIVASIVLGWIYVSSMLGIDLYKFVFIW